MDEFRAGELPFTQFVQALELLLKIYVEKPTAVETFAIMVFNRAEVALDEMISFSAACKEAFDSNLVIEYFDIGLSRL